MVYGDLVIPLNRRAGGYDRVESRPVMFRSIALCGILSIGAFCSGNGAGRADAMATPLQVADASARPDGPGRPAATRCDALAEPWLRGPRAVAPILPKTNLKCLCDGQPFLASMYRRPIEIPHWIPMPQIWMTYDELAAMLDCTVVEARARVRLEGLDRKISRDGKKRAKLNMAMTGIFIEQLKTIDYASDRAIEDLRRVHGLLSRRANPPRLLARLWSRAQQAG
jgi:hypothetical protein